MPSETDLRARIVEEARSWLGTPYHHHAMVKGAGVDCAMLLVAVYGAVGLLPRALTLKIGICTAIASVIWGSSRNFAVKRNRRRRATLQYGVSGGRFRTAAYWRAAARLFTATSGAAWCRTTSAKPNLSGAGFGFLHFHFDFAAV
ncbi:hypothetical protein Q4P48_08410 [Neisseria gonorrhoeae]|nr:hypothetical protein [Neisseria gonorrhoeae]